MTYYTLSGSAVLSEQLVISKYVAHLLTSIEEILIKMSTCILTFHTIQFTLQMKRLSIFQIFQPNVDVYYS